MLANSLSTRHVSSSYTFIHYALEKCTYHIATPWRDNEGNKDVNYFLCVTKCVNPVVVGKACATQYYCGNRPEDTRDVVPILLHGDAAFAGQGV
eukprot:12485067-Ditylum_brightwellii.AAC.2